MGGSLYSVELNKKEGLEREESPFLEPLIDMGKVGDGSGATPVLTMGWSSVVDDIRADAIQPVDVLPTVILRFGFHDAHGI
jgi:hypothetical protein